MTNQQKSRKFELETEDEKIRADLEARLNAKPTLNTDVMEFLAVAGLSYTYWEPFLHGSKRDPPLKGLYEELENTRLDRTRTISRGERITEGWINKAVYGEYASGLIRTVGDLKKAVERGSKIPYLKLGGIAYLNRIFEQHGLEPMTVVHASKNERTKNGLVKSDPRHYPSDSQ